MTNEEIAKLTQNIKREVLNELTSQGKGHYRSSINTKVKPICKQVECSRVNAYQLQMAMCVIIRAAYNLNTVRNVLEDDTAEALKLVQMVADLIKGVQEKHK